MLAHPTCPPTDSKSSCMRGGLFWGSSEAALSELPPTGAWLPPDAAVSPGRRHVARVARARGRRVRQR
eukprot:4019077-Prymnesium_polylepis.1